MKSLLLGSHTWGSVLQLPATGRSSEHWSPGGLWQWTTAGDLKSTQEPSVWISSHGYVTLGVCVLSPFPCTPGRCTWVQGHPGLFSRPGLLHKPCLKQTRSFCLALYVNLHVCKCICEQCCAKQCLGLASQTPVSCKRVLGMEAPSSARQSGLYTASLPLFGFLNSSFHGTTKITCKAASLHKETEGVNR